MWRWLHPLAEPRTSYRLARRLILWLGLPALALLLVGTLWGMLWAPADCKQGDGFRIIYLHVPSAFLSMGLYAAMALMGAVALIWQHRFSGYALAALGPVGAAMTALALLTGAIWGKPMWGAWWVWDARLTSELILLFLYIGVLALYHGYPDRSQAGRAASILALVGVVNLPIIHYSVVWWNTLHQGATIAKLGNPAIAADMLWPLLINLLGFSLLCGALVSALFANEMLRREAHRPWVKQVIREEVGGE
ncbi:MAG: heme ABC transporter permease [Gammaproteobacteria bacterium]|nr:heme ABC transporter permease [Gammaproteobacteria bacterium]